jgi:hypothetical protein
MTNAKGKAKTAAAVTSVLAVSGGVATAYHMHQNGLRNSAEAASQDSNTTAAIAAANALAARAGADAANRDLQRPSLPQSSTPGAPAPSSSGLPTSAKGPTPAPGSSTSTPPVGTPKPPTSTTTTTKIPLPTQSPTWTPIATPTPTKTTTTPPPTSTTTQSTTNMGYNATPEQAKAMAESIVPSSQFMCFSDIIERESSWNLHATNPYSGAYGLGQALPGYKMASMGSEWRNSALIQIKWALSYMTGRYGSPCAAWAFWQAHDWY